jgi:hypothetical protein
MSTRHNNGEMTPAQRLAISRARIAQVLSDPAWLILLQRLLKAKDRKATPAHRKPGV